MSTDPKSGTKEPTSEWPTRIWLACLLGAVLLGVSPIVVKILGIALPTELLAGPTMANWGQWLSGIFAPAALVVAVLVYRTQLKELAATREELALSRDEMKQSTDALRQQAEEQQKHSKLIQSQIDEQKNANLATLDLVRATHIDRLSGGFERFDRRAAQFAWAVRGFPDPRERAIIDAAQILETLEHERRTGSVDRFVSALGGIYSARVRADDVTVLLEEASKLTNEANAFDLVVDFSFETKRFLRSLRDGLGSEVLRRVVEYPLDERGSSAFDSDLCRRFLGK